jgi:hypothetical protein
MTLSGVAIADPDPAGPAWNGFRSLRRLAAAVPEETYLKENRNE